MRIIFCKIANMNYYKGIFREDDMIYQADIPDSNDSWVKQYKDACEKYNFKPTEVDDKTICRGYVKYNGHQIHIENIRGCEKLKQADKEVNNILVVWFTNDTKKHENIIVGWYKNATVYRIFKEYETEDDYYNIEYSIKADAENCVLLPKEKRRQWKVPYSKTHGYGFGQSHVWYAREEKAEKYLQSLIEKINSYSGENWINEYPPLKISQFNNNRRFRRNFMK